MANIKFSQFTVETAKADVDFLVGYSGPDNVQISPTNLLADYPAGSGAAGQVTFFSAASTVTGDNDFYWNNANKRLGVGTTTPETRVTIKGDALNTNQPNRITNVATDTHTALFINGTGASVGEKYGIQFGGYNQYSIGGIFGVMDSTAGSTSGDITFDFGNGTAAGALIERVRFTHEGNVGIGTTSPAAKLEVNGTLIATGISQLGSGGSNVYLTSSSAGSVGIGTSSPSYKLDIYGDAVGGVVRVKNVSNGRDTLRSENAAGTRTLNFGNDGSGHGLFIIRDSSGGVRNYITGSGDSYFNGGNVGIGTSSPGVKFVVNGGSDNEVAKFLSTDDTAQISISDNDTDAFFGVKNGLAFISQTGGTPASGIAVDSSGNVGIGTNSPVAKLHVYQNNSDDDTTAGVTIEQDGTGDAALSFLLSGIKRWRLGIDNNDYDKFKISDATNLASSNKLTIDTSGNVGIGTTSPTTKFQVAGNSTYISVKNTSNYRAVDLGADSSGDGQIIMRDSSNNNKILFYAEANSINYINNGGNFGIGTSSPASKLEVDGGDIEVDDSASGLILRSPDGTRYRVTVANGGTLSVSAV